MSVKNEAVSAAEAAAAAEVEMMTEIWPKIRRLLKEQPQRGMETEELVRRLGDPRMDNAGMARFLQTMMLQHCVLGLVNKHPPRVIERPTDVVLLLRALPLHELRLYQCVELRQRDGVPNKTLQEELGMSSRDVNRITRKLSKLGLIHVFTHRRTKKKMNILMHLRERAGSGLNSFQNHKGQMNAEFVEEVWNFVFGHLRDAPEREKGVTAKEIATAMAEAMVVTKRMATADVERILMLLIIDGKAEIVPSSLQEDLYFRAVQGTKCSPEHLLLFLRKVRETKMDVIAEIDTEKERRTKKRFGCKRSRATMERESALLKMEESFDPAAKRVRREEMKGDIMDEARRLGISLDDEKTQTVMLKGENDIRYRALPDAMESAFGNMPCLSCPVASQCKEGGVVNPVECDFMNQWLQLF